MSNRPNRGGNKGRRQGRGNKRMQEQWEAEALLIPLSELVSEDYEQKRPDDQIGPIYL